MARVLARGLPPTHAVPQYRGGRAPFVFPVATLGRGPVSLPGGGPVSPTTGGPVSLAARGRAPIYFWFPACIINNILDALFTITYTIYTQNTLTLAGQVAWFSAIVALWKRKVDNITIFNIVYIRHDNLQHLYILLGATKGVFCLVTGLAATVTVQFVN